MIDENILRSLKDFSAWFQQYNQNKKDQQDFGVRNMPARVFRKTIDLSTAGVLQNTGIPFNGLHIEKVYLTATGTSVEGSINLIFDRAMSDSQFNYKVLKENDSFTTGFSVARGFLSWSAQAGVSVDIVFFNDIDYRAGSSKTSLIGTVTTTPANTVATLTKRIPALVTRMSESDSGGSSGYTVRTGYYAEVYWSGTWIAGSTSRLDIAGAVVARASASSGTYALSGMSIALAGELVELFAGTSSSWISAQVVEFPI